jgi:hypothetical protein
MTIHTLTGTRHFRGMTVNQGTEQEDEVAELLKDLAAGRNWICGGGAAAWFSVSPIQQGA